jgi:LuxR family transcriptional regulator, maltose regulon positive regulatory protein
MTEVPQLDIPAARRHIIKRPRLTRLLDETTARVILLVAPAGYGKTTLAREWLAPSEGPTVWYLANTASADVANLASNIARAATATLSLDPAHLVRQLAHTEVPERAAVTLAEALARDFRLCPDETWLVLDDYHFISKSRAAEEFVEVLIRNSSVSLLLTTRVRPAWASARRAVYGEICEIGPSLLAMTNEEASAMLGDGDQTQIVELAAGWPAVLGLAAMAPEHSAFTTDLPDTLHEYFADELYKMIPTELREKVALLSIVPQPITLERCQALLADRADTVLAEALRVGLLTPMRSEMFDLHPLLRQFLKPKTERIPSHHREAGVERLATFLSALSMWDDAFAVLEAGSTHSALLAFLSTALPAALRDGRLSTVDRWLAFASTHSVTSPTLDLAAAEVALRRGEFRRADVLAARAIGSLRESDPAYVQGMMIRGRSALLQDEYEAARDFYTAIPSLASDIATLRAALWGAFVASRYFESGETVATLAALEQLGADSAEASLRLSAARLQTALLVADPIPIGDLVATAHVVADASDPHAITNFLQNYVYALIMTGQYEEALVVCEEQLRVATQYGLTFVDLNTHVLRAFAFIGLRRFEKATQLLDAAELAAEAINDLHNLGNIYVARFRILLAQGRSADIAREDPVRWRRSLVPSMLGEYLGTYAIALACAGLSVRAHQVASSVDEITRSLEAQTAVRFARAIVAAKAERPEYENALRDALDAAREANHLDGIVMAYRAYPPLLEHMLHGSHARQVFTPLMCRARDALLARRYANVHSLNELELSPRESEVLGFVARGFSNRRIAAELFISEATVKVHVRHIFEKLGVNTRTEAALLVATSGIQAAPSS